jgi:hypothetical protein
MSAIAIPSAKEFIALLQQWSPEERAEIGVALGVASATKKTATKKAASAGEERLPVDLSTRPEMPEKVELNEDLCHARVGVKLAKEDIVDADKDDWLGRESGLKFGGFRSKIFLEVQCGNSPASGQTLCSGCLKNKSKHDPAKWTAWKGVIGEAPPPKCRFIRSDYSNASYEAWGDAPRSVPSSGRKASTEPKVAKEPKEAKEAKPPKPTAPKPAKKAAPAAAAVVPSATEKKPVQPIADDLTLNPVLDCFINSEGVCFYADLDETTLEPIPDMSRIVGSIPKGMDPEEATEKDFTPA